jgi:hypothetical protein
MINHMKTLRDNADKFVHSAANGKEMDEVSKARTAEVKPLEREKKDMVGGTVGNIHEDLGI